jgi:hypothetical protein
MTPANQNIVKDWITAKVPTYHCSLCGANKWSVGDVVMPPLANNNLIAGQPMAVVQCGACGHLDLFDAISIGLKKPYA